MPRLASTLTWIIFALLSLVMVAAPWCFGAWEMWWFWPFSLCIFAATLALGVRLLVPFPAPTDLPEDEQRRHRSIRRLATLLIASFIPFLIYALVRAVQSPVVMDAERSFLLHLTPLLVGLCVCFGLTRDQSRILWFILIANLYTLGLYGIANYVVLRNACVLGMPGAPQYQLGSLRATGSYYCPDHYAGIMELLLCLALGLLLTRNMKPRWRGVAGALAVLACTGVVLSKSRGGVLTLAFLGLGVVCFGFVQWPPRIRWYWRLTLISFFAGAAIFFVAVNPRFKQWINWNQVRGGSVERLVRSFQQEFRKTSRGRMYAAALRAWKTAPVTGIGPGMHQHYWPHFSASPDGDREAGTWPTFVDVDFFSYEVHSDWLQLLEEYGLIGLLLFLFPCATVAMALGIGLRRESRQRQRTDWWQPTTPDIALIYTALFAYLALAFHSLGDFNLQMPATVWMLAAILALGLRTVLELTPRIRKRRR
jgi:O-antigen ligase